MCDMLFIMWINYVYDETIVCAIVHNFANMYGAFDVILYFVNSTFSCQ